jgi:hypothetical protein
MFLKEMYQREKNIFKKKCIAVRTMLFATLDRRLSSNEEAPLLIVVMQKMDPGTTAFQIVAGWWRRQPGQPAVGGVLTAHMKQSDAMI